MGNERRRFIRFDVPLQVEYRVPGASHGANTRSDDFSRDGLKIAISGGIITSDNLDLKITIPQDDDPIFARAKVAWTKDGSFADKRCEAGLKFEKIANNDRSRILDYAYERWKNQAS